MSINLFPEGGEFDVNRTAFGELRIAELTPKIQLSFPYNINSRLVQDLSGGGGSLIQASGMAVCSTSANANASGVLASRRFVKYQPGEGTLVRFTALFTEGVVGSEQLIGAGDALDGFFFGYDGSSFGVLRKRDGIEEWTPRSSWNVNTKPSLDPTLGNVYQITYQWLGFGHISFCLENPETGNFELVHTIKYANSDEAPSIFNPSLPMCVFAGNTTNTSNIVLKTASMGAFIEGKEAGLGIMNASGVTKNQGTTLTPIISYKNTRMFQGISNRTVVQILRAYASNDGTKGVEFIFFLNPVLTGSVFLDLDPETSVIQIDSSATAIAGGFELINGLVGGGLSDTFSLDGLEFELQPGEVITIAARRLSGADDDVNAGLIWRERP